MGLFSKKKIELKSFMRDGVIQYFIDYHEIKESDKFLMDFIEDFIEDKNSLLVIDTDNFYKKKRLTSEDQIMELKELLDKQDMDYNEIKTIKQASNKIFGIKIEKDQKVNHYQLALALTSAQLRKATEIVKAYNVFYYVLTDDMGAQELTQQFYDVRGDYDELNKLSLFHLYIDYCLQRIVIYSDQDIEDLIKMKLQKYQA